MIYDLAKSISVMADNPRTAQKFLDSLSLKGDLCNVHETPEDPTGRPMRCRSLRRHAPPALHAVGVVTMPRRNEIALHYDGDVCQVATTTRDCDRSHRWIPLDLAPTPRSDRDGIAMAMHALLRTGWDLFQVWDGEDVDIFYNNQNTALDAIMAVDDAMLIVRRPAIDHGSGYESGWVRFVLGNDPGEVICDYTTNLTVIHDLIKTWIQ